MKKTLITLTSICLLAAGISLSMHNGETPQAAVAQSTQSAFEPSINALWESEFEQMQGGEKIQPGSNSYVLDEQFLLLTTDKDPLDVQLQRTRALIANLKSHLGAPYLKLIEKQMEEMAAKGEIVWPEIDCDPKNPLGTK